MFKKRLPYGIAVILTGITILSGPINFRIIYHYLESSECGLWILMVSMLAYVPAFDFGLNQSVLEQLSARGDNSNRIVLMVIQSKINLLIAQFVVIGLIGVIGLIYLCNLVPQRDLNALVLVSWGFIVISMYVVSVNSLFLSVLLGTGEVLNERLLRAFVILFSGVGTFLSLKNGGKIVGLAQIWLLTNSCLFVFLLTKLGFVKIFPILVIRAIVSKNKIFAKAFRRMHFVMMNIGGILILQSHSMITSCSVGLDNIARVDLIVKIVMTTVMVSVIKVQLEMPFVLGLIKNRNDFVAANIMLTGNRLAILTAISIYSAFLINYDFVMVDIFGLNSAPSITYAVLYGLIMLFEISCYSYVAPMMTRGFNAIGFLSLISGLGIVFTAPKIIGWLGLNGLPITILAWQCITCYAYILLKLVFDFKISFQTIFQQLGKKPAILGVGMVVVWFLKQMFVKVLSKKVSGMSPVIALLTGFMIVAWCFYVEKRIVEKKLCSL